MVEEREPEKQAASLRPYGAERARSGAGGMVMVGLVKAIVMEQSRQLSRQWRTDMVRQSWRILADHAMDGNRTVSR